MLPSYDTEEFLRFEYLPVGYRYPHSMGPLQLASAASNGLDSNGSDSAEQANANDPDEEMMTGNDINIQEDVLGSVSATADRNTYYQSSSNKRS